MTLARGSPFSFTSLQFDEQRFTHRVFTLGYPLNNSKAFHHLVYSNWPLCLSAVLYLFACPSVVVWQIRLHKMEFWPTARCFQTCHDVCCLCSISLIHMTSHSINISYSYLATLPLLVFYSVVMTSIKFQEGSSVNHLMWSPSDFLKGYFVISTLYSSSSQSNLYNHAETFQ